MRSKYFFSFSSAFTVLFLASMTTDAQADSKVVDGNVQSIFLTSPKPGSEVTRGEEITVTWTSQNCTYINIVLMKGNQEVAKLGNPLLVNKGVAKVKIPKEFPPTPDQNQFTYYIGIYPKSKFVTDKRVITVK